MTPSEASLRFPGRTVRTQEMKKKFTKICEIQKLDVTLQRLSLRKENPAVLPKEENIEILAISTK